MDIKINRSSYICRICEENKNLIYIFEENRKHIPIRLQSLANVNIEKDDELPQFICATCIKDMDEAYKFRILCEYTDNKLRNAIDKKKQNEGSNTNFFNCMPKKSNHLEGNCMTEKSKNSFYISYNELIAEESTKKLVQLIVEDGSEEVIEENLSHDGSETQSEKLEQQQEEEEIREEEDGEDNDGMNNNDGNPSEMELFKWQQDFYEDSEHLIEEVEVPDEEIEDNVEYLSISSDADLDTMNEEILEVPENQNDINIPKSERKKKTKSKTKEKSKVYTCETCRKEFDKYSELNKHKKTHGDKRFRCLECNRWFARRYYLTAHQMIHTPRVKYQCPECNKNYSNPGNLDRHIRAIHQKERKHVCDKCGKGFSQSATLKQHYIVHLETRDFECDVCHKTYKTKEYLNLHKETHIPIEKRKMLPRPLKRYPPKQKICICTYCGKKSTTEALHQSHMRTHTGDKPYKCRFCEKKFSFSQSLKSHLLVHTGEKPFKCNLCNLNFRQAVHLKYHQLVHTGEKRHKCLVCDKSFALRGNLTVHMRLHTGETPYHCTVCSKKFYDSNGLKRHRQVHMKDQTQKKNELTDKIKIENVYYAISDSDTIVRDD